MDRRELLGLLGTGTVGLAALGGSEALAQDHEHMEANHKHLKLIGECAIICNMAAHHCLGKLCEPGGDQEHHAKVHEMAMDCQEFCTLTVTLMARSSPLGKYAHAACADACRDCAEVCEKSKEKSEIIQKCAAKCRECEKACREMAKG